MWQILKCDSLFGNDLFRVRLFSFLAEICSFLKTVCQWCQFTMLCPLTKTHTLEILSLYCPNFLVPTINIIKDQSILTKIYIFSHSQMECLNTFRKCPVGSHAELPLLSLAHHLVILARKGCCFSVLQWHLFNMT